MDWVRILPGGDKGPAFQSLLNTLISSGECDDLNLHSGGSHVKYVMLDSDTSHNPYMVMRYTNNFVSSATISNKMAELHHFSSKLLTALRSQRVRFLLVFFTIWPFLLTRRKYYWLSPSLILYRAAHHRPYVAMQGASARPTVPNKSRIGRGFFESGPIQW